MLKLWAFLTYGKTYYIFYDSYASSDRKGIGPAPAVAGGVCGTVTKTICRRSVRG